MTNEKDKKNEQEQIGEEIILEDSADKKPDEEPVIETAKNFNELYDVIKKTGEIIGSDGTEYDANDLIDRIDELREGLEKLQKKGGIKKIKALTQEAIKELMEADGNSKMLIRQITRAEGLRNKVVKLAIDEVITREVGRSISEETKNI